MAVTITRTARIDDDGTGTTGTVINNAEKTSLYNEIDTALAKVAQLAGGNSFTGNQAIAGEWRVGAPSIGACQATIGADNAGHVTALGIQNLSATPSLFFAVFYNQGGGAAGYINQTGATTVAYATTSDARLKEDHGRATDLTALRGVVVHDFRWTADGLPDRGVFAQEAHRVFPRAVTVGTDATTTNGSLAQPWMTDYSKFVPDLIAGWQQHDATLAEIVACLERMKG